MKSTLLGFLNVARNAGIAVSTAESIDAFGALELIGLDDRQTLKDALELVLAKTPDERERFEQCFERYFALDRLDRPQPDATGPDGPEATAPSEVFDPSAASPLARILLDDDRAALVRALYAAAMEVDLASIHVFTQTNAYVLRMLERIGLEGLSADIARLRGAGGAEQARVAQFLDDRRGAVRDLALSLVERRLALNAGEQNPVRDESLRDARLSNVDRRDVDRMRTLVREMARRLAIRHGRVRKRARRGHLDVRHTMRRNVAFDGVPFRTAWKRRKVQKARVVVLCDVSGSVASLAHFLLLFAHSLNEALGDIRSFAFSDRTIEVTDILEDAELDAAMAQIMRMLGFRSSDYGRALEDFEERWSDTVDRKTTVLILGDARTNYGDPRVDIVQRLFERSKRLIWLNPESRGVWGTDDSEMLRYLPYCHVAAVCNRLRHLEQFVTDILKPS